MSVGRRQDRCRSAGEKESARRFLVLGARFAAGLELTERERLVPAPVARKVIAVIQDTDEIKHILRHLIKIGRARPGLDESSVN